ncbi:MAG TPA: DNA mismatch repair endonuclease MutL [Myxococcaceae bacterium]|nr:DNA mismatch repair endonuclease MutL [Myxococcaceae bacterium]
MSRITLLSEELIDQIAAGEVVERPASVVKELGENALDAGARHVVVRLSAGGTSRIEVIDDGTGMSPEDAPLALRRHATSKLSDAAGLKRIATFGFRGEALAAVASVSRVTLRTSEPGAAAGTEVRVEAGALLGVGPAPARAGTQVVVEDLFAAVPARRKFLRRTQTELRHCEQAVLRLALAHPAVGFRLEHEGRTLLALAPSGDDLAERMAAALGGEIHPHLLPVDERRLDLRVHGSIASPEYTEPSARALYTFVNGRFVRDRVVHAAIHRGLQPLLPAGRQPAGVLFVELEPSEVDVNVHPQKLEVRFADAAGVGDAVQAAVGRAVRAAPWWGEEGGRPATPEYAQAVERFLRLARDAEGAPLGFPGLAPEGGRAERAPAAGEVLPARGDAPAPGFFGSLRVLGLLGRRALACEGRGGSLVVVDLHAARERACLERLMDGAGLGPQAQLPGSPVSVRAQELAALAQRRESLAALGLAFEGFGAGAVRWTALPAALRGVEDAALLRSVLDEEDGGVDALRRALACAAATCAEATASEEGLGRLLGELDRCDFGRTCRHGRVVTLETPLLELVAGAPR